MKTIQKPTSEILRSYPLIYSERIITTLLKCSDGLRLLCTYLTRLSCKSNCPDLLTALIIGPCITVQLLKLRPTLSYEEYIASTLIYEQSIVVSYLSFYICFLTDICCDGLVEQRIYCYQNRKSMAMNIT